MTDVNDNIPEWSMIPAPYLAVVSSDAPAGSLVYKLHAQDGDEGNNGEVEYFMSDGGSFSALPLHAQSFNKRFLNSLLWQYRRMLSYAILRTLNTLLSHISFC